MNKKAVWGLLIAVILPVASYFLVKNYSENAIPMPPRFYADSTVEKVLDGKKFTDTFWHKVENISLTNQLGEPINFDSIPNKILVIDFFFTHCPSICPGMTRSMKRMQDMMHSTDPRKVVDTPLVQFLSISIDPERDSVPVLKKYADRYGIDHDTWWMLTGNKEAIYNFGIQELKLGIIDGNGQDTLFDHSPKFVLLDKDRIVRGYYNGLDSNQLLKLSQDVVFLSLEKDKRIPSPLFKKLKALWPVFLTVIASVIIFVFFSYRDKKQFKFR
jgi:protein SCO1/2